MKAAPTTIQVYKAAVRSFHVEHGDNDPFSGTPLPPGYSLAPHAVSARTHARLPIMLPSLRGIVSNVRADHTLRPTNQLTVAAASSLALLGFLRYGEALAFKRNEISVKSGTSRSLKLTIQKSMTDSFRQGCVRFVGSTNAAEAAVCPVRLTETYMSAASTRPPASPLFTRQHGWKRTLSPRNNEPSKATERPTERLTRTTASEGEQLQAYQNG